MASAGSVKSLREAENERCLGGMRNPSAAGANLPALRTAGGEVCHLFECWAGYEPAALRFIDSFGTPGFEGPPEELIAHWRHLLRRHFRAREETHPPVCYGRESPVAFELLDAWQARAGDVDRQLKTWLRDGCPLGMEMPIEPGGAFPPIDDALDSFDAPTAEEFLASGVGNYSSPAEFTGHWQSELERLEAAHFVTTISRETAVRDFGTGTASRMALITKPRPDGSMKCRIIVDLRRSGANARASCPERVVLPRPKDVVRGAQYLSREECSLRDRAAWGGWDTADWACEFASGDFADAYMHFRIHASELKHCLSPHPNGHDVLLRAMLCFGLKSAPLIFGRFSAALGRLLQGMFRDEEVRLQIYLDDPLLTLFGPGRRRTFNLALFWLTICSLGVKVSWKKCQRGLSVAWIGVGFGIDWPRRSLTLTIPELMAAEILGEAKAILSTTMVGLKRLQKLTGRLSWAAGVLPRSRWAVSICYAVIASVAAERQARRGEPRSEPHAKGRRSHSLVHTKRVKLALEWTVSLWSSLSRGASRAVPLRPLPGVWTIVTDASPWGLGGVLLDRASGEPLEFFSSALTEADERTLGITVGDSSAQAVAEALAVWVAFVTWRTKLASHPAELLLRSDSTAALALAQKLASSSPALNFIGAELALVLETTGVTHIDTLHLAGSLNTTADWLSRLDEPEGNNLPRPTSLRHAKERVAAPRIFHLPPPGECDLWGRRDPQVAASEEQPGLSPAVWEAVAASFPRPPTTGHAASARPRWDVAQKRADAHARF